MDDRKEPVVSLPTAEDDEGLVVYRAAFGVVAGSSLPFDLRELLVVLCGASEVLQFSNTFGLTAYFSLALVQHGRLGQFPTRGLVHYRC